MTFCNNCGKKIQDDGSFCHECKLTVGYFDDIEALRKKTDAVEREVSVDDPLKDWFSLVAILIVVVLVTLLLLNKQSTTVVTGALVKIKEFILTSL